MLDKKSLQPNPKVHCFFLDAPVVDAEETQTRTLLQVRRGLSEELQLILELIDKYQRTVFPFLSKIQEVLTHVLENVYCFGPTKTIGSFCDNLHLPWSDLNFFVNCNEGITNKKPVPSPNKSSLNARKQGKHAKNPHRASVSNYWAHFSELVDYSQNHETRAGKVD